MPELRPEDIQEILNVFAESDLEELRLEVGSTRLHVSKKGSGPGSGLPGGFEPQQRPAARLDSEPAAPLPVAQPTSTAAPANEPPMSVAPESTANLVELKSPLLGVFYRRPAPDQPAFDDVGADVSADDAVCIIDVMKMFTSVPAGVDGRVVEILAEDGQLVEFDQVLMRIEPR
jgi:acetyl-CoA carboxylase biotin carboxyl carrier protein